MNCRVFLRSVVRRGASITAAAPSVLHACPWGPRARLSGCRAKVKTRICADLAERLGELPREREQVVADLKSARDRFRGTVSLPRKPEKGPLKA